MPGAAALDVRLTHSIQAFWMRVANCETGGNWRMRGSSYSGGTGMANTTYRWWASELHLLGRYPNAADAPRAVQIEVSEYGYRVHHGYWGTIANGCAGRHP